MERLKRLITNLALCQTLLVAGAPVAAQSSASELGERGLWTVGVSTLTDDESSSHLGVSFDVAAARSTWVSLLAATSRSPRERADISADTVAVGIDHRFGLVGIRAGAERWGDSGAIESTDLLAGVYLRTDRISVALGFEQRDIDLTTTLSGPNDRVFSRTVPLSADGASLDIRLRASDRVQIRFGVEAFDYPPGLALLPRIDALNLLSASTLTLANSFVSDARYLAVDVELGAKVLSLGLLEDESAIDHSELDSIDAALLIPVGRRFDLEISLGRSNPALFDSGFYAGILLLVYGGG